MYSKMIIYVTGILVFFTVIIAACEKDKKSTPPELPPLSSFSIAGKRIRFKRKGCGFL